MILLSLALIFGGYFGHTQVIITSEALPQPGDTFALRYDVNPSIQLGAASTNSQHWDFSSLAEDSLKFATYGISNLLPFASSFPNSNLYTYGPSIMYGGPGTPINYVQWGWMMFNTSSEGMSVIGYRVGEGTDVTEAHHDVPLMLAKTPFTINDFYSQTSKWSVVYNRVQGLGDIDTLYTSYITSSLTCDAWGTLTTPTESNISVVRLKEYRISVDSVFATTNNGSGDVVVWKSLFGRDTVNNYQYYTPNKRHALATVFCKPDNTIKSAQYLYYSDLHTKISEDNSDAQIMLSPNPARDFLNIHTNCTKANVIIYSQQGSIVRNLADFSSNSIDIKDLAKGLYFIILRCNSNEYKGKFIKE